MATVKIHEFFVKENRPFSSTELLKQFSEEFGKNAVQNTINDLVANGDIFEKNYDKQKIYCIKQNLAETSNQELMQIEREINEKNNVLENIETGLKKYEIKLKQIQNKMSIEEASAINNKLMEEIKEMQSQLDLMDETKSKTYTEEERKTVMEKYKKIVGEYKKRKRTANDMIEAIFENYPKSKKQLLQEIGMETDESVNFQFKNLLD